MREYQHKHMVRTLLYSKVTIVVLFLAIVLLLRSVMELNDKRIEVAELTRESKIERDSLEEKVSKAEEKNRVIETPRGLESYIRATYPVVKDGEGVIVVYDDKVTSVAPVKSDMNVWERLLLWWRDVRK